MTGVRTSLVMANIDKYEKISEKDVYREKKSNLVGR